MGRDNTCVCCGDIVPEGRMVCWACEHGTDRYEDRRNSKKQTIEHDKKRKEKHTYGI